MGRLGEHLRTVWARYRGPLALPAAALWVTLFLVLFGMWVEGHTYKPVMVLGGLAWALMLLALGLLHPLGFLVLGLPMALSNAVYAHVARFWRIGNLLIRIQTALDSSPREAQEFLLTFVVRSKYAWFLLGYVVVGMALAALYWRWYRRARPAWPLRWRLTGVVAGLVVLVTAWPWVREYPFTVMMVTLKQAYEELEPLLARKRNWERIQAQVPPRECNVPYEKILFVLGESANRDYMSLYGFEYPTTPFLESLEGAVVLRAISPVNQTMTAVPIEFTAATVTDYERFYTSPSVITYLRRCGYQTFWISNQLRYSPYTSSVSSIASEADVVRFALEELSPEETPYDEVLLQLLPPEDIVPGRKQAFFIHLLGSHFNWADRYPPERALIPNPKDLVETYINTIAYTDQVLAWLFERVVEASGQAPMLFIYTSDHGEYVVPEQAGHAFFMSFQEEYRVPLVYWSNLPEDPRLQRLAREGEGRLVNTETLDLTLLFLLGWREDPGLSFSTQVLALGPPEVRDYTQLQVIERRELP